LRSRVTTRRLDRALYTPTLRIALYHTAPCHALRPSTAFAVTIIMRMLYVS